MIPVISQADMAFPAGANIVQTYDRLIPLARAWEKDNPTAWGEKFFSMVFFGVDAQGREMERGHKVPAFKEIEGMSRDDSKRVLNWLRAGMGSRYPQHQDKEAVCAMLWTTFFEPPEGL